LGSSFGRFGHVVPTKPIFFCDLAPTDGACTCATTIRKKDGKVYRYWRLVRSVRIGGRVVQQTVAHLGELDEHGRIEARALARQLIGTPEQAGMFDDGTQQATVPVRLKGIRLECSRRFGGRDGCGPAILTRTAWSACGRYGLRGR
jgi:hypothetical protein